MNFKEILNILQGLGTIDQFANEHKEFRKLIDHTGPYEIVKEYGGEGKGETWYKVFYFTNHDVYIKVDGFYSSYEGVEFEGWDDATEVRPTEKTITVYN